MRFSGFVLNFWSVDYRGGLELLFGSQKKHEVDVVPPVGLKEVNYCIQENIAHGS